MENIESIPDADKSFVAYLKRKTKMNKRNARLLISDLEDAIEILKDRKRATNHRLEKNVFACQIENKQAQIDWALKFLNKA